MFRRISSITHEISDLGIGDGGYKVLFVDQANVGASDSNPGSRSYPFKTINGALAAAGPMTNIYINGGNYTENVIVPSDKIQLIGVARSGPNKVSICPPTGAALAVNGREFRATSIELVTQDGHGAVVSAPHATLERVTIEIHDDSCGIYANYAADLEIVQCTIDGNNAENSMGIYLYGAPRSIIKKCRISNFGSGVTHGGVLNGYGIALAESTFAQITDNWISESFEGVHVYTAGATLKGHSILRNKFWGNSSIDIADLNDPSTSRINIRGNSFLYTSYLSDEDHDGLFDGTVSCGLNYDYAPTAHVFNSEPFTPRRVT